jgi:MFS superfamily sulfate permease-like transporter
LKRDHKRDLAFRPLESALEQGLVDAIYTQSVVFQHLQKATGKFKAIALAVVSGLLLVGMGLLRLGVGEKTAGLLAKLGPVVAIIATTGAVWGLDLAGKGVRTVGIVPQGLPALMISVVGYVESISVALTLAAKKRQRIDPDQELIALGTSNIGPAISGGFPVTGGFSRSVVNFDAGAETPAAGAFTAVGIALATIFLTPLLYFLPNATLAATLIVVVLSLIDCGAMQRVYKYSITDFAAMVATILLTLMEGVEAINAHLKDAGITLHLSEVKGPVMDRLRRSHFLGGLTGQVHLTQFDAVSSIDPELARRTLAAPRGPCADDSPCAV